MSRPKRNWYPGATYHVMSRGNRRLTLYKDDDDYLLFLEGVSRTKEIYPFKIHSLCLMTNHFHMAIETSDKELWKIMQRILHPYAMNFNRKYHYTGHLFEDRYTACLIEDERYFLEVSRYIHLNPVKAQMVREPLKYVFSSYELFMDSEAPIKGKSQSKCRELIADLVDTSRVLACFRNNPHEQYRMFVEGKISHAEQEMLIQKDMKEDDTITRNSTTSGGESGGEGGGVSDGDDKVQIIIAFCDVPHSKPEIQKVLGIKSERYVREKLINPLLKDGRLRRTEQKLNSKNQRYVSTKNEAERIQAIMDNNPVLAMSPGDLRSEGKSLEEYLKRFTKKEEAFYRNYYFDEM